MTVMSKRTINFRLAKVHRAYTTEEAAKLYGIHTSTVRNWLKQGLPSIDAKRPTMILGRELVEFHRKRRKDKKHQCGPGELFCVRCHLPKRPAGDMADLQVRTPTLGNLVGICPDCDSMMNRVVSIAKLDAISGGLDITIVVAQWRVADCQEPPVNTDFTGGE